MIVTLTALTLIQDPIAADASRIEQDLRVLVSFGTRHPLSPVDLPGRGTGAAREWLESRFEALREASGGRLIVQRQEARVEVRRSGMPNEIPIVNILATLPGTTDADRVYVIGGHYDSRNSNGADGEGEAPGANDDGSGTVAMLEACRLLCTKEFPATIVFAAYDGEEQGLLGSGVHAKSLAEAGKVVDGMITNDIVGNTLGMDGVRRRDYVRVFSYAPSGNDSLGRSLARSVTAASRGMSGFAARLVFRGDRYGRGGDHRPFFEAGFPSVRFTEPREDFSRQHQDLTERDGKPYGDVLEFVDFDYVARVATLNARVMGELAAAPRAPTTVRIEGARDAHDTIVNLGPVEGAAAYDFVWRETTAPDWEHERRIAADALDANRRGQLRFVLQGVSIDEVVVGVRAVAADGARSRVTAAPEPDAMAFRGAASGTSTRR
jgi:Zn-dependent M28 family amino/carboxypeptidase